MANELREAYVCEAVRTPIGRYGGALSAVRTDDLAAFVLRELAARASRADWEQLDEVILGCANQAGEDNRNVARIAALLAGLPITTPGVTVNRLCASGLEAVAQAARLVRCGEAELVIAGGVESMSRAPFVVAKSTQPFARDVTFHDTTIGWRFINPAFQRGFGTDSMPETAENLAAEAGISRADQDAYALRSQQRALAAQARGRFAREIAPVPLPTRKGPPQVVEVDEHPRETTLEQLARLPAPFRAGGSVTAGNASGVNDGACALLVASEAGVRRHGLTPRARIVGAAAAGVPPRTMGLGPVPATRRLIERLGVRLDQVDVIELNEAFAAQSLAVLRALGLPDDAEHVNPNGGAIALGHPLGMSGARLVLTATAELVERQARYALCTLCVGVGQGMAVMLERAE
jgi:acetyl-CoA acyltransferase